MYSFALSFRFSPLIWKMCVFLVTALPATNAFAQTQTVQDALVECKEVATTEPTTINEIVATTRCGAIAEGVGTILTFNCWSIGEGFRPMPLFAASKPPNVGAALQSFVNWATENPNAWDIPFSEGMARAISEEFPCHG